MLSMDQPEKGTMQRTLKKRALMPLSLVLLFVLHVGINIWWVRNDNTFYAPGSFISLGFEMQAYHRWRKMLAEHPGWWDRVGELARIQHSAGQNSPFTRLVMGGLFQLTGAGPRHPLYVMTALLPLLLLSAYLCGRACGGPAAGLLAAVFSSLMPGVFGFSRHCGFDYPMAVAGLLCLALLLLSQRLQRPWINGALGLTLGIGLLVKGQLMLFFVAPLVLVLALAVRDWDRARSRSDLSDDVRRQVRSTLLRTLLGLATVALVSGGISAVWWWGRVAELVNLLMDHAADFKDITTDFGDRFSALHLFFYVPVLLRDVSVPLMAAFGAALVVIWRARRQGAVVGSRGGAAPLPARSLENQWMLLSFAACGMVLFALMIIKTVRFIMPAYPVFAIVAAVGLLRIRRPRLRRGVIAGLLVILVVQFVQLTFPVRLIPAVWWSLDSLRPFETQWGADSRLPLLLSHATVWAHPPEYGEYEETIRALAGRGAALRDRSARSRRTDVIYHAYVINLARYREDNMDHKLAYLFEAWFTVNGLFGDATVKLPSYLQAPGSTFVVSPREATGMFEPLTRHCRDYRMAVVIDAVDQGTPDLQTALGKMAALSRRGQPPASQVTDRAVQTCARGFTAVGSMPFLFKLPRPLSEEIPAGPGTLAYFTTAIHNRVRPKYSMEPQDQQVLRYRATLYSRK